MARSVHLKPWENYEEVAKYLLNELSAVLGLDRVEGKQKLSGVSGTEWEVDAKGIAIGNEAFILVECRRTKYRQSQSKVAALAYSINDTGAAGGIIVTPVPLQLGAQKIANANDILHVQIDLESTPEKFAVKFLNKLFVGITSKFQMSDSVTASVWRVCKSCGKKFELIQQEQICPSCVTT